MIAKALMTMSITTLLTLNVVLGFWLAVISYLVVQDALDRTNKEEKRHGRTLRGEG